MPELMNSLSEEQRARALEVIDNLRALEMQADAFIEKHKALKAQLETVSSWDEFFVIVDQIVRSGTDADKILLNATCGLDGKVAAAVDECIKDGAQLKMIWDALHFSMTIPDCILATKERLSEQDLSGVFSGEKRDTVIAFIERIKALKPIADILHKQKDIFQHQLMDCSSMDEVDEIEKIIETHNSAASTVYDKEIVFPTDEDVAGALIKYFETNPHIQSILTAFDLYESLVDDLMDAKMRVSGTSSHKM